MTKKEKQLPKVYTNNEVEARLFARIDTEGKVQLSHAIINGQRYYPEDLKLDTLQTIEKLLVFQYYFGFENKTE